MTNIAFAPDVRLDELRGKPVTIVCEIVKGKGGQPELRALHPHTMTREERWDGQPVYRFEQLPQRRLSA